MSIKLRIDSISKERHVKDRYRFLDVSASLIEVNENGDETVVSTIKRGYPLGTSKKEIKDDLSNARKLFISEQDRAVAQAVVEEEEKNADTVIKDLEGSEIKK